MARDSEKHENYGESMRSDTKPDSDEGLNNYYNRKQKTKGNKFAADTEAEVAGPDRNAEEELYRPDRDASFLNYKRWDRYGGK